MMKKTSEILIVDDIPRNIQVISNILKKEGYEISFALNAEQGLKNIAFQAPDLILLDVSMPGMDGFEFCKELKKDPQNKEIPVIFLTAHTEIDDLVKGLEYGAVDYITKPFNAKELLSRIATHLELKQSRDIIIEQNHKIVDQNEELKGLNATKDKFFSIIAHDLKNPFHILVGYSKILFDDFDDLSKEQIRNYLDIIYKTSQNSSELLENLLHWSRAQRGLIQCCPVRTKLIALVHFSIELLESYIFDKQIDVSIEVDEQLYVLADKQMTNTIIRNLLSNAVKFTPREGKIKISAYPTDENMVEVCVSDNGKGISEENLNKLFRIEQHITTLGTENEKGTGLGLLLCKEFVEKNKGTIVVKSQLNEGSSFCFTLPAFVEK